MEQIKKEQLTVIEKGNERISISLRPITDADTEQIVTWRNSSVIRSQFIFRELFTAEMHTNWLRTRVDTGKVIQYIIEDGANNKPIGSIYLRDIDLKNESGEFGIYIGETDYMSKGYGSLATKAFVDFCLSLGFHRVFLRVLASNKIAQKTYKKAGFFVEGTARDMIFVDGKREDVVFMSILNDNSCGD